MNIAIAIAALLISAFVGYGFFKAGSFKAKSSEAVLLSAGFGWVEKAGMPLVRVIAWLELLAVVGVILARHLDEALANLPRQHLQPCVPRLACERGA